MAKKKRRRRRAQPSRAGAKARRHALFELASALDNAVDDPNLPRALVVLVRSFITAVSLAMRRRGGGK